MIEEERAQATVKAFMNWLVCEDRLTHSPAEKLKHLNSRGKETIKRRALQIRDFPLFLEHSGERSFA